MRKFLIIICLLSIVSIAGCGGGGGGGGTPPAPKVGSVSINSTPSGAKIFIDEQDKGVVTPNTISNLTEGQHTLKLEKEGRKPHTQTINIAGDSTITVNVILDPLDAGQAGGFPTPDLKR